MALDGLEKDLAEMHALASSTAEHLRQHQQDLVRQKGQPNPAEESEKTLAGLVIGKTWDLVAGKGGTGQERIERAHRADQYAEIAADTFASIPKFSAVTSGIAHSVMLIDVSGQESAGGIARGMALNFVQGAAFNSVSKMAGSESAVGRMVGSRLGLGLTAEVATHAISGGGFGLVKSGLSESSWMDKSGSFSFAAGVKNIALGTSVGTVIGIPAGMAGMRAGKIVTLGLGSSVETSATASVVQKFATGAGSGFASGSVFGGVDAARGGKSWSEIVDGSLQGGLVGALTGGVTAGFDRSHQLRSVADEQLNMRAGLAAGGRVESQFKGGDRDLSGSSETERMLERADLLMAPASLREAYDRHSYKIPETVKPEDYAWRLKPPVAEKRAFSAMKEDAPQTFAELKAAMNSKLTEGEALDINKHFWEPFVSTTYKPMRVYSVEGHTTKIVVPEEYAQKLDEVRDLRKAAVMPESYKTMPYDQKAGLFMALRNGDTSAFREVVGADDLSKYIKFYQVKTILDKHPLGHRALPEDLIPIMDALPNPGLLKEVNLFDSRNPADVYKSVVYDAPGFQAAATVGASGVVDLYQSQHGSALYNTMFHEWAHVAKWQSPAFSKLFDLASVVDHVDLNDDHPATAKAREAGPGRGVVESEGMYYPNLHSTRNQDENFAVGLGENVMGQEPDELYQYVGRAPVRSMVLSTVLERNLLASNSVRKSAFFNTMNERVQFASQAARPYAIGTVEKQMETGTPAQKAAAAQVLGQLGTIEQSDELLAMALDKKNHAVPDWKGTAAEEAMAGDKRTVAQHAFDSYLNLVNPGEGKRAEIERFSTALNLLVNKPELRQLAGDYALRSGDMRLIDYAPLIRLYNPNGTALQRAVGVELIKKFGGENKSDMLLSMAMDKNNDNSPDFSESNLPHQYVFRFRTVAQSAYNAYVETSGSTHNQRVDFAFQQGMQRGSQAELASNYLLKTGDSRARGLGQFLQWHDLPGHVNKMQELITDNFSKDPVSQKMVFDRMMDLTNNDQRKQIELLTKNLHVPGMMESALTRMDVLMGRGINGLQRQEIRDAISERRRWENYSDAQDEQMNGVLKRIDQENALEKALQRVKSGSDDKVGAINDLVKIHDQRAIKPLLQQAVSGNEVVAREAIGALQRFNPALVKFYAQELKREYSGNPVLTLKITDLVTSHRLSPPPSVVQSSMGHLPLQ